MSVKPDSATPPNGTEGDEKGFLWQPPTASTFVRKYTRQSIRTLSSQLPQVRGAANRVEAFTRFADIEKGLEPVEEYVYEVAGQIDEAIQLAIDAARGK